MHLADARPYELEGLRFECAVLEGTGVTVRAATTNPTARCPLCGRMSQKIHSRYRRSVFDLPWRGIAVKIEIRARRFFCGEASCERRVFCERLEEVAARRGRPPGWRRRCSP